MKVVFAGTPEFAAEACQYIAQSGFHIPLILTQPDRRAGRGMKLLPSAVKQFGLELGAKVLQPTSLKLDGKYPEEAAHAKATLEEVAPDVMVVAAYGLILPQWVLDLPKYGCLNIHASLLPRWRGAAPIHRAIEAGDEQTGICIMKMDAGLDTGDIVSEDALPIGDFNTGQLHDQLAILGAKSIVKVLAGLPDILDRARPQPQAGVTYAEKITKAEAQLDLSESAEVLVRKIRAFNPFPGASITLPGSDQSLKIWQAQVLDDVSTKSGILPGEVLSVAREGIDVQTGSGVLRLTELQKPGARRQPVESFIQGWQPPAGKS